MGRAKGGRSILETSRRRPIRWFLLRFGLLLGVAEILFVLFVIDGPLMTGFLEANAHAAALLLDRLGWEASATGPMILGREASITVGLGCDGSQPLMLFAVGVLAFPTSVRWRVLGIGIGIPVLLAANLARIVLLFWVTAHHPQHFHSVHAVICPVAFVLLLTVLWTKWMQRAHRSRATTTSRPGR